MIKVLALIALLASVPEVQANQSLVNSCQRIVDQKQQAQDLRRKGGKSSYMNRLKKEIKWLDKKYSELRCYRIRTELKR